MEMFIGSLFRVVSLAFEIMACAVIVVGAAGAAFGAARGFLTKQEIGWKRKLWLNFAAWIVFGLEFALAADIVKSLHTPSWDELGKLAVVAILRIVLSFFVWRDLDEVEKVPAASGTERGSGDF